MELDKLSTEMATQIHHLNDSPIIQSDYHRTTAGLSDILKSLVSDALCSLEDIEEIPVDELKPFRLKTRFDSIRKILFGIDSIATAVSDRESTDDYVLLSNLFYSFRED